MKQDLIASFIYALITIAIGFFILVGIYVYHSHKVEQAMREQVAEVSNSEGDSE